MKYKSILASVLLVIFALVSCSKNSGIVRVEDGHFVRNGKKVTHIGTNFWYGAILASEGEGGDIERLVKELDTLKGLGITNLRVMVGADGRHLPYRTFCTIGQQT